MAQYWFGRYEVIALESGFVQDGSAGSAVRSNNRTWTKEWIALIGGIIALVVVLSPPADEIVDRSFSAHMLQHMVLTMLAAPLLAYAGPLVFRRWASSGVMTALHGLTRPFVALILSAIGIWMWHFPRLYDAALEQPVLHSMEHLVFIVSFIIFWRPLMTNAADGGRLRSNEARVLYLTVGMFTTGLLAAYITLARHLIYTHYEVTAAGERTPLADQQLGGAYMLVVGTIALVAALLLTLRDDADRERAEH